MSGIHKSREVYKYTPTRSGRKLVPVRGLYVSGLHTEPRYMDHWLEVAGYTSNDGDIVDYTEIAVDKYIPTHTVIGIESAPIDVVDYTTSERNALIYTHSVIGVESDSVDIVEYTTSKPSAYIPAHTILHVESGGDPTVIDYSQLRIDSSMEHILTINGYTSSECIIADVT